MLDNTSDTITLMAKNCTEGGAAGDGLFGGNILAPRASMTGPGSYEEGIQELGVTGLRYPGGSLTEHYFDIEDPDASVVTHSETGETSKFIPISEFMRYAEENESEVTIVLPTWYQLSEKRDVNGDRSPEINEEALREFVHDLTTGVYGNADIAGIEIGNEYWGSGKMNAVEYGRLSSEMATIIDDELKMVSEVYGIETDSTKVLVQMGCNYGISNLRPQYEGWESEDIIDDLVFKYSGAEISYDNIRGNGDVNWSEVNNELLLMSYDTPEKVEAIDGVIAHVYTYGKGDQSNGNYSLNEIKLNWLEKDGFEDLEIFVTEWNMKSTSALSREDDYGLFQAHEMLNIVEHFIEAGVEQAHVWPLIQNTSNPLSTGFDFSGPTVPGQMFAMMSKNLPGKTAIDFTPGTDRSTEFCTETVDVHAFAGEGDMVLYIASTSDTMTMTDIDLSNFVTGYDSADISVLGVGEGQNPGSTRSTVDYQALDDGAVLRGNVLEADLDQGEIMQVVLRGIKPSEDFAPLMNAIDGSDTEAVVDPVEQGANGEAAPSGLDAEHVSYSFKFPEYDTNAPTADAAPLDGSFDTSFLSDNPTQDHSFAQVQSAFTTFEGSFASPQSFSAPEMPEASDPSEASEHSSQTETSTAPDSLAAFAAFPAPKSFAEPAPAADQDMQSISIPELAQLIAVEPMEAAPVGVGIPTVGMDREAADMLLEQELAEDEDLAEADTDGGGFGAIFALLPLLALFGLG